MDEVAAAGFRALRDLEAAAERRLDPSVWAYVAGGAGEESGIARNRDAFRRRTLRPRALAGVDRVDLSTALLGTRVRAPYFVAPTAYQRLIHPEGELATARAAGDAGVLAVYSTLSSCSLEEIAAAAPDAPRWFQLYLQPEWTESRQLVERAEAAGYSAIVLTVDAPVLGVRDRQAEGGVALDFDVPIGNGPNVRAPGRGPERSASGLRFRRETATRWEILDRLREITSLPIVVKGLLTAEDAGRAVAHGARGIIVSNHGGRQIDSTRAPLDALSEVLAAAGGSTEVYLDGGIRRADDVLIALASGARAVGLGRPVLWALACGGRPGVAHLFRLLEHELAVGLALLGRPGIGAIDASLLDPSVPVGSPASVRRVNRP